MIFQFFGSIQNPLKTLNPAGYGDLNEGLSGSGGGLAGFISNLIRLITIGAGVFAMFNLILAGVDYITSEGDPQKIDQAKSKIRLTLVGIIIIVAATSVTAILSQILFGDPTIILTFTIFGPG